MFTQPCFIRKNSKELQERVYRLGGRSGNCIWESEFNTLLVADKDHFRCYDDEWDNADKLVEKVFIDCGTNEDLFLAIASLRDDTDKGQWFIYDSMDAVIESFRVYEWIICDEDKIEDMFFYDSLYLNTHKATVQELIEHFKDK